MTIRKGFSLIEIMVAMTLLSIVLLGVAKISTAIAIRSRTNDLVAKRTAALQLEANKVGAAPYSMLAGWATRTDSVTRGTFRYSRTVVFTRQGPTRYSIKIVVAPTLDPTKKDSIMLDRSSPPTSSPLCTGC